MRRGDIVIVRERGTPAGKRRPCVVIQRDSTLAVATKVTVCPLTTSLRGPDAGRPQLVPTAENGLRQASEVQIDWIYTFDSNRVIATIGRLDATALARIDEALRRWLDL